MSQILRSARFGTRLCFIPVVVPVLSCIVVNVVEVDLVVVDEIRPVNTDQQIAETLHDTEEDNPISVQMYVDQ